MERLSFCKLVFTCAWKQRGPHQGPHPLISRLMLDATTASAPGSPDQDASGTVINDLNILAV